MAEAIESGAPTFQTNDSGGAVEAAEQKLEVFGLAPSQPNAEATGRPWPAGQSAAYVQAPQGHHRAVSHSQFQATPAASPWTPVAPGWFPAYPVPYFLVPRRYPFPTSSSAATTVERAVFSKRRGTTKLFRATPVSGPYHVCAEHGIPKRLAAIACGDSGNGDTDRAVSEFPS
ncbi:hypothetical protein MTO96_030441 [Rhipicephalus appendiculatus]